MSAQSATKRERLNLCDQHPCDEIFSYLTWMVPNTATTRGEQQKFIQDRISWSCGSYVTCQVRLKSTTNFM